MNTHVGAVCNFLPRYEIYPYEEGEREGFNVFFVWECLRGLISGTPAYIIPDEVGLRLTHRLLLVCPLPSWLRHRLSLCAHYLHG